MEGIIKSIIFRNSAVFAIFVIVATCFYLVVRVIAFGAAHYSAFSWLVSIALIFAETFVLLHTIGYMIEIVRIGRHKKTASQPIDINKSDLPKVAVVVAAKNEPKEVLQQTLTTLNGLDYPNKSVYLIDDSTEKRFSDEADELGELFNIKIYHHTEHEGAKAGAINDFIRKIDAKYLAVFDADQNPMPDFLLQTVTILEHKPKVAFVQTPQFYSNFKASPIAMGASMQQAIFYENICEGKSLSNAMFCCGTNVVFRLKALESVGGFDETSITEDFATSLKLQTHGWDSFYYPHVSAFGLAPETLPAYFKQQARWATGTIDVFRRALGLFLTHPRSMKLVQWWEYFLSGTYYFMGWIFLVLILCPIIFLIFNVPSYFLLPQMYFAAYIPYIVMALLLFYSTMGGRKYSFAQTYYGSIMGNVSFPVLIKAAIYGLAGKKMPFQVTSRGKTGVATFKLLWPYYLVVGLCLFAIGWGIGRLAAGDNLYAVGINMFWVGYHAFVLGNVFYLNQPGQENKNIYAKLEVEKLA